MTNKVKSVVFVILVAGLLMSFLTVAPTMIQNTAIAEVSSVQDQSGHVEKFRIAGKVASAQWYSENSDAYSEVSVYLVDADSKPEGYYSNPTVIVQVWEYELIEDCIDYPDGEQCHYVYEFVTDFFGFAEPKRSDFSISGSLRTASIDGVEVTGYDYVTGDEMTIKLDASWIASGSLLRQKQSYSEQNEDYVYSIKSIGIGRDATASAQISGDMDLTLDGDEYLDSSAMILKAKEGYMVRTVHSK